MDSLNLGHEGPIEVCSRCLLAKIDVFDGMFEHICVSLTNHPLYVEHFGDVSVPVANCPGCGERPKRLEYEETGIELAFCEDCAAILLGPFEAFAVRAHHFSEKRSGR